MVNEGTTFTLQCEDNGRYQSRYWQVCREPMLCFKPPPRPPVWTGLARSESRNVQEPESAVYECQAVDHVVPGTVDGRFRVPCKKSGNFVQSQLVEWEACEPKNPKTCEDVEAPPGYAKVTPDSLAYSVGETVEFTCEDPDMLVGDQYSASFICGEVAEDTYAFLDFDGTLPDCREPVYCDAFFPGPPEPTLESGLELPLPSQDIIENGYLEYRCLSYGFSLTGIYTVPDQFSAENAEIADGRLRLYCTKDGAFSTPAVWPRCRDTSITECDDFPDVSDYGLEASTSSPVAVMDSYTISCVSPTEVTDHFRTATLVCDYDGEFVEPSEPYTDCRAVLDCDPVPEPPESTNLEVVPAGFTLKEFDVQEYQCEAGFSLDGVVHPMVGSDNVVSLTCTVSGGSVVSPAAGDWPICLPVVTECTDIPSTPGLILVDSGVTSVDVGDTIRYRCEVSHEVSDLGWIFTRECLESGLFSPVPDDLECRDPVECEAPPEPDEATTRLTLVPSVSPIKEWTGAKYQCNERSKLSASTDRVFPADSLMPGINELYFYLECGLDGKYPTGYIPWPQCQVTHCLTSTIPDYTTAAIPEEGVPVGDSIDYSCTNPNYIAGDSLDPVTVECLSDGNMDYPGTWPTCRAKEQCDLSYPDPPAGTYLTRLSNMYKDEFDYVLYPCQDGAHLNLVTGNPDVIDGKFRVQCGLGGVWPDQGDVTWPTCTVEECVTIPTLSGSGFQAITTSRVPVGSKATYECSANYVTEDGPYLEPECLPTGEFDIPGTLPDCRPRRNCDSPPTPDAGSFLVLSSSTSTPVKDFETVYYSCQDGANIGGVSEDVFEITCDIPSTVSVAGSYSTVTWPTCSVEFCVDYPDLSSDGLTPVDDAVPVPIGEDGLFECPAGQVAETAATFGVECLPTGEFETPGAIPDCRAAAVCPTPPVPQGQYNLQPSASGQVTEYGFAEYECEPGAVIEDTVGFDIVDGKFMLECLAADTTYGTVSWPTCVFKHCVEFPDMDSELNGFAAVSSLPVPVNEVARFRCDNMNHVMDGGKELELTCNDADGTFAIPNPLPECRNPQVCAGFPPTPAGTGLQV